MTRASFVLSLCLLAAIVALLVVAGRRVDALETGEINHPGPPVVLAPGEQLTLLEIDLREGDEVTFELCSANAMLTAEWRDAVALSIDAGAARENVVTVPLSASVLDGARRGDHGACLTFATGTFQVTDHYVVSARDVTQAVAGIEVRGRVLARRSLSSSDRNLVFAILVLALALALSLALAPPTPAPETSKQASAFASGAGAIGGVGLVVAAWVVLGTLMPSGATFGLVAGLTFTFAEIAIGVALVALVLRLGLRALAIERPQRRAVALVAFGVAPVVGIALRFVALWVLQFHLSTGTAPIEAFVSWPSGLLSFAVLSVVAPIGEEIFFRGFVYGTIYGRGGTARATLAFLGAWLLFVLAHLPQTVGNWGGLLSIALAGLGFTVLRATTRSTLVPIVAHLVYNGLLAAAALMGG